MGFTSLQVCMDSPDWLQQGTINEEYGMDSSSSPSGGDILNSCSRPLIERRLRPPHDQLALKCPRCDSTHTKFCYYNNYSLTQPRYFCKTCRRYWTKGGTLRNIPVGGGCRKNKKVSKRSSNEPLTPSSSANQNGANIVASHNQTDLQLSSFPDQFQFSHMTGNMFGNNAGLYNMAMLAENSSARPIDFMESKLEAIVGSARNYDFMGEFGSITHHHGFTSNFCSPFGMTSSHDHAHTHAHNNNNNNNNNNNFMEVTSTNYNQRLALLPNYDDENQNGINAVDVKPNTKHLSLEWQQDQGNKDQSTFGYLGSSWNGGMINSYGSSATNPLV
ncbi:hypothetical protein ACFE04_027839 [Oxalis oulophora]